MKINWLHVSTTNKNITYCVNSILIFFTSDLKYHCEFFFIFFNLSFLKWNVCVVFPCSNRATKFPEIKAKLPFCPRNKIAHLNRSRINVVVYFDFFNHTSFYFIFWQKCINWNPTNALRGHDKSNISLKEREMSQK